MPFEVPHGHQFVRVTDEVKPRREYSIPASALDEEHHVVLDKPAVSADGTPLPTKHYPESLTPKRVEVPVDNPDSGAKAATPEEKK